mgnify:CR=1 FL=1
MLLTMDIGNTNINIGLWDGDELTTSVRLATERQKTDDQYALDFTNIFVMHKVDFNEAIFKNFYDLYDVDNKINFDEDYRYFLY